MKVIRRITMEESDGLNQRYSSKYILLRVGHTLSLNARKQSGVNCWDAWTFIIWVFIWEWREAHTPFIPGMWWWGLELMCVLGLLCHPCVTTWARTTLFSNLLHSLFFGLVTVQQSGRSCYLQLGYFPLENSSQEKNVKEAEHLFLALVHIFSILMSQVRRIWMIVHTKHHGLDVKNQIRGKVICSLKWKLELLQV